MIKTGKIFLVELILLQESNKKEIRISFTEPTMQRSERKAVCVLRCNQSHLSGGAVYLDGEDRRTIGKEGGAGHAGPSQQF